MTRRHGRLAVRGRRRWGRGFRTTLFDRFGHDTNAFALIFIARRGRHLMTVGRVIGFLFRQGQVVDLVVAGLVTLRIRAVVGKFARDLVNRLGGQVRARFQDRGIVATGFTIDFCIFIGGGRPIGRDVGLALSLFEGF